MKSTLGIDEAGRGPILGPMVVAGVLINEDLEAEFLKIGVRDSKRFSGPQAKTRRAALAVVIREKSLAVAVRVLTPAEIDAENLGDLERRAALSIIHEVREVRPLQTVMADGRSIFGRLAKTVPNFCAEDKADSRYIAVAAASIVAKDLRDRLFEEIRSRYAPEFGAFAGGGYPNEATLSFLAAYRARHGDLPPEARRKWKVGALA